MSTMRKIFCFIGLFHKWGPWGRSDKNHDIMEEIFKKKMEYRSCVICKSGS